jgi:hypothetical protein
MITSMDQHLLFGAADGTIFHDGPIPQRMTAAVHLDDGDTELLCGCHVAGHEVVRTTYVLDPVRSAASGRWTYVPDEDQSDADVEPESGW